MKTGMFTAGDFAETYDPQGPQDAEPLIRHYYAVIGFQRRNQEAGPTRIASLFGLSVGRVRGWLNETVPDVVRGLEFVEHEGWIGCNPDRKPGHQLAILTVGIYACGSISETFQPRWSTSSTESDVEIWDAIRALGFTARRGHVDDDRPREITVKNGTYLGRTLVAIGANQGGKTAETVAPLPVAILEADERTRETCAALLVRERGTQTEDAGAIRLQLRERSSAYRKSVLQLLTSVAGEEIRLQGDNVIVSAGAAEELGVSG